MSPDPATKAERLAAVIARYDLALANARRAYVLECELAWEQYHLESRRIRQEEGT